MNVRELFEALETMLIEDPTCEDIRVYLDPRYKGYQSLRSVDVDYENGVIQSVSLV